jgi:hypothetical protein
LRRACAAFAHASTTIAVRRSRWHETCNLELDTELQPKSRSRPSPNWGGARNRRDRVTEGLTVKQAQSLMDAALHASQSGLHLNRHTTIHLERLGIKDANAAAAVGRYLKLMRDWVSRRGGRTAWIWVRENDIAGQTGKGSHVHILWHLPASLRIGSMSRRWAIAIANDRPQVRSVYTTRVGGRAGAERHLPEHFQTNLAIVLAYLLKGTVASAGTIAGISKLVPGGHVTGKRCGTSQNIGPKARRCVAVTHSEMGGPRS